MKRPSKAYLVRVLALLALFLLPLIPASQAASASGGVTPNAVNMLDCNGWSQAYKSLNPGFKMRCTDPIKKDADGSTYPFTDNGHYVGHDEPSVKYISSAPGSGNHMIWYVKLPKDPAVAPSPHPVNGQVATWYAELSVAPWFGMPICDPNSNPMNACTPDSDTNTGMGAPTDAGSAFHELQFYPPGFSLPGSPSVPVYPSGDQSHWTSALNIDSLECTFAGACNPNCTEPVNYAFIQQNGVPTGPPSPQLANSYTFLANNQSLLMNSGDTIKVEMQDTAGGYRVDEWDLTTGSHGFMVASAANGFMNTDPTTCAGTPFNFHPEYDTAKQQNQVPWAALEGGILSQQEIGHGESCDRVSNQIPLGGPGQTSALAYQECTGGMEPGVGETCQLTTGLCAGVTENNQWCGNPGTNPTQCELSDGFCYPAGANTLTFPDGTSVNENYSVSLCGNNAFQNGDLDFDGNSYYPDWPDGTAIHPTPYQVQGPFQPTGASYPSVQFETDLTYSEAQCHVYNDQFPLSCTIPPIGSKFYPYWTLGKSLNFGQKCTWLFGNTIKGLTTNTLGGDSQYFNPSSPFNGLDYPFRREPVSQVEPNPALGNC